MSSDTGSTTTPPIQTIVLDVDGTLLDSRSHLSERNVNVLKAALAQGVQIILATGKTRVSTQHIIDQIGITTPGIYLQGVGIYGADGAIIHQQTLDPNIARQVITFAEDRGFTTVAYSGRSIYTRVLNDDARILSDKYHEPVPEAVGPLQNRLGEISINKLIAIRLGDARRTTALRWQLNIQLDGRANLVQALPDMLEFLPKGASKGAALRVLLRDLSINPANVMAIGDGDNDLEMIQLVGIGVAMGNATQKLKDAAVYVTASHDEDGVAQAVQHFIPALKPQPTAPAASNTPEPGQ
jgi:Cof subfamily protein (haloacid dehalogenase superfamily)